MDKRSKGGGDGRGMDVGWEWCVGGGGIGAMDGRLTHKKKMHWLVS